MSISFPVSKTFTSFKSCTKVAVQPNGKFELKMVDIVVCSFVVVHEGLRNIALLKFL